MSEVAKKEQKFDPFLSNYDLDELFKEGRDLLDFYDIIPFLNRKIRKPFSRREEDLKELCIAISLFNRLSNP